MLCIELAAATSEHLQLHTRCWLEHCTLHATCKCALPCPALFHTAQHPTACTCTCTANTGTHLWKARKTGVMPDLSAALIMSVRSASGSESSNAPIISAPAARAARWTAVLQGNRMNNNSSAQHAQHKDAWRSRRISQVGTAQLLLLISA